LSLPFSHARPQHCRDAESCKEQAQRGFALSLPMLLDLFGRRTLPQATAIASRDCSERSFHSRDQTASLGLLCVARRLPDSTSMLRIWMCVRPKHRDEPLGPVSGPAYFGGSAPASSTMGGQQAFSGAMVSSVTGRSTHALLPAPGRTFRACLEGNAKAGGRTLLLCRPSITLRKIEQSIRLALLG